MEMSCFSAPRKLLESDDVRDFISGVDVVDAWVHRRAHRSMRQGTAVVYVVYSGRIIAGLYALSAHSVLRTDVEGGRLKRNSPEHISAILLGMLGVDVHFQGQGLGASLLRDAILRSVEVSGQIGARALLVDPANSEASAFFAILGLRNWGGQPGSSCRSAS